MICDKFGQEITVGCYIASCHRVGDRSCLQIGKVINAEVREVCDSSFFSTHQRLKPQYAITVRGIDDFWISQPLRLNSRNGVMVHPDRIIVLDPEQVPETYRKLLDSVG